MSDIKAALITAESALATGTRAMAEFQLLLVEGDWDAAEECRLQVTAHVELYLDSLAEAYHKLRDFQSGTPQQ